MNLTATGIVATLVIIMAMCAATCDLLTSHKEGRWASLPGFIRWEFRITAGAFLVRGVDLYSISTPGPLRLGQVNLWALVASVCLFVTVVSLTGYALSLRLPFRAWDRLRFARDTMRADPRAVPLMVSMDEVTAISRATGQPTVGAGGDPAEVLHEGPRHERMKARARRA